MDLSLVGMMSYFKNNWENIYVFVWLLFMIIILFNAFNIDVSNVGNKKKQHIDRIAIYQEGFKEGAENKKTKFCDQEDVRAACEKIKSQDECTKHDCCVYAVTKNKKTLCQEGDTNGPDVEADPNGVAFDYYFYKKERKKVN